VNGDGFSDVIVGAPLYPGVLYHGAAFLYHGSASGLVVNPSWAVEGEQEFGNFGNSVMTAGDVNGDGFSDVIVGDPLYGNVPEALEGRAYAYYGNAGDGLDRIPRQVRTDDAAPIAIFGKSNSESAFRLKALGRTAAGRGDVHIEYEVKPYDVPFDGTGLVTGPALDSGTPSGAGSAVPLTELASGLVPETLYHWRLRIVTDSPFWPRSRWFWPADNGSTEADLRTKEATASVTEESGSPAAGLQLAAPAPNPFTSTTRFDYTLAKGGRYRLAIYDVQGRQVAVIGEGSAQAGSHSMRWDGRDQRGHLIPSGIYFLRLESPGGALVQKMVIAR
jgi:hypothetical protein